VSHPIVARELLGILRTRRAFVLIVTMAAAFTALVILRWPTDPRLARSGAAALELFRLFAYALLTGILLFVPVFPAASIVREKNRGTLALLLNSPLSPLSIYLGKLAGGLGFVLVLLSMSLPGAAACYALGGPSLWGGLAALYGLLLLAAIQYATLALLVSSRAASADSAQRITFGLVLLMAIVSLGPHLFLQGHAGWLATVAEWLRCLSPIPAVMSLVGHGDVGGQGLVAHGVPLRFALLAAATSLGFALATLARLNATIFDRARSQGVITNERGLGERVVRRLFFLIDPQRRSIGIPWFLNPVMVKEFRSRRFGRLHWLFRTVAICAVISLSLTILAATGTLDWGVETIGGILVVLQVALIALITPSLAAGLLSTERESGGWELLMTTPVSAGRILRGKLASVGLTLALILLATLPGYAVMLAIKPAIALEVQRVVFCLLGAAGFVLVLSAAVGSLWSRTAAATAAAYTVVLALCAGTILIWLGRGAPFGHSTVEAALTVNPMAAALSVIKAPGFAEYELIPGNWWFLGVTSAVALLVLSVQTWRLTRPR
jgi:ABC-type transport system involved in multi-copper enzyme maturation permease subunit